MKINGTVRSITKKGMSIVDCEDNRERTAAYGCPGDEVLLQLGEKGRNRKGVITEITKKSEFRIPLKCTHAGEIGDNKGKCGGCSFQYIDYQKQLEIKQRLVWKPFFNKYVPGDISEIIPSPQIFHYRNRMDFVVTPEKGIGMREKGSWDKMVNLEECYLITPKMEKVRQSLLQWLKQTDIESWNDKEKKGFLQNIIFRETKNTNEFAIIFITHKSSLEQYIEDLRNFLPEEVTHIWNGVLKEPKGTNIADEYIVYKGTDYLTEEIDGVKYLIAPSSFFQTNMHSMEILLKLVLEWGRELKPKKVMDLFCGSGFFALGFAKFVENVEGVELNKDAISLAEASAKLNGYENTQFSVADLSKFEEQINGDLVIVDPPRAGLTGKFVKQLLTATPKNIIYVSCNPETLAFNLRSLKEKYSIDRIQPLDMFPHTPHVETVVLLTLKN